MAPPEHSEEAILTLSAQFYSPNCREGEFSEVGGLSLRSDYGDRAMGVADNSIRDTAHQSPP
jgi:hypothetical protein